MKRKPNNNGHAGVAGDAERMDGPGDEDDGGAAEGQLPEAAARWPIAAWLFFWLVWVGFLLAMMISVRGAHGTA